MKRLFEFIKSYLFFFVKAMIKQADAYGYFVYLIYLVICFTIPFVGMIILWILSMYIPEYFMNTAIIGMFLIFSPFIPLFYLSLFFFNQHFVKDTLGDRNIIGRPRANSVVFWRKYLKLDTQTGEGNE